MIYKLISVFAVIIASCLIMIIHEFPKSLAYSIINAKQSNIKKHIFKVNQYIDPIGLIFSVTCHAGFSKPYMYRIKDKRTNLILGIIGLNSLLLCFIISIFTLRIVFIPNLTAIYQEYINIFKFEFVLNMAWLSMSMLIVNLFPVSTFDISLIIASKSPSKYFSFIQDDHIIKIAVILGMVFGIISSISRYVLYLCMARG